MAYPKITVNTGLVLNPIASDTLPIPSPDLPQLSGSASATTADKLVDAGADFSNVQVNDIVYNTTDKTSAFVTAVDSSTSISVSVNIFASGEDYIIFLGGPHGSQRINSSEGCLIYVGSSEGTMDLAKSYVDIKVKTVSGNDVTFSIFKVGEYLPVQCLQIFSTGTDAAVRNNCLSIW